MDFAASLVMNDYLGPLELRACRGVNRSWRSLSGNALRLPRVKERAARTIQRAWRNSPKKVRQSFSREIAFKANDILGLGWGLRDLIFTSWEGMGRLVNFGFPPGNFFDRVITGNFFGHGVSVDVTSRRRVVTLRPWGSVITNFKATGKRPAVLLEHEGFLVDITDHPDAVIPTSLLQGEEPRLTLGKDTESVSYTVFVFPGSPGTTEGPVNGLPGVGLADGRLFASFAPRRGVSKRRILGEWA